MLNYAKFDETNNHISESNEKLTKKSTKKFLIVKIFKKDY